jgi:hypothetical protein
MVTITEGFLESLTGVFIRNKHTIQQTLTILLQSFLLLVDEQKIVFCNSTRKLMVAKRPDGNFTFCDYINGNKGNYEFVKIPGEDFAIVCRLMLPLAVELAACPHCWSVVTCNNETLTLIEFGQERCDVFLPITTKN